MPHFTPKWNEKGFVRLYLAFEIQDISTLSWVLFSISYRVKSEMGNFYHFRNLSEMHSELAAEMITASGCEARFFQHCH